MKFDAAYLPSQVGQISGLSRQVETGPAGAALIYGPYLIIPEGEYEFEINYTASPEASRTSTWDVAMDTLTEPDKLQILSTQNPSDDEHRVSKSFQMPARGRIQIRVLYGGQGKLTVENIRISKIK